MCAIACHFACHFVKLLLRPFIWYDSFIPEALKFPSNNDAIERMIHKNIVFHAEIHHNPMQKVQNVFRICLDFSFFARTVQTFAAFSYIQNWFVVRVSLLCSDIIIQFGFEVFEYIRYIPCLICRRPVETPLLCAVWTLLPPSPDTHDLENGFNVNIFLLPGVLAPGLRELWHNAVLRAWEKNLPMQRGGSSQNMSWQSLKEIYKSVVQMWIVISTRVIPT